MAKVVALFPKTKQGLLVEKLTEILNLAKNGYFSSFTFAGKRAEDGEVCTAFANADPVERTELIAHQQFEAIADGMQYMYKIEKEDWAK